MSKVYCACSIYTGTVTLMQRSGPSDREILYMWERRCTWQQLTARVIVNMREGKLKEGKEYILTCRYQGDICWYNAEIMHVPRGIGATLK